MRNLIIEHGWTQYDVLEVGGIAQLPQPRNDKYFRMVISVRNKSNEEATELIEAYMQEVYDNGYMVIDNDYYKVSVR